MATFSAPRGLALDEIWHGQRTSDITRGGSQGSPLGYQPGRSIEHEPVDKAEQKAQQTAQAAGVSLADQAASIRPTLRGGFAG